MTNPVRFREKRERLHSETRHTQVQVPTLSFAVDSLSICLTLGIRFSAVKWAYSEYVSARRLL